MARTLVQLPAGSLWGVQCLGGMGYWLVHSWWGQRGDVYSLLLSSLPPLTQPRAPSRNSASPKQSREPQKARSEAVLQVILGYVGLATPVSEVIEQ